MYEYLPLMKNFGDHFQASIVVFTFSMSYMCWGRGLNFPDHLNVPFEKSPAYGKYPHVSKIWES